jgi:hypothetical protein
MLGVWWERNRGHLLQHRWGSGELDSRPTTSCSSGSTWTTFIPCGFFNVVNTQIFVTNVCNICSKSTHKML